MFEGLASPTRGEDRFAVPPEPRKWAAAALSLLMHLLLIVSLLVAVQWQTRHVPLQAELWREIPQELTAPPTESAKPPTPPPEPPKAEPEPPPPPPVREPAKPVVETAPEPPKPKAPDIAVAKEKNKPEPKAEPKPKPAEKPPKAKPAPKPKAPDFSGELAAAEQEVARRRETQDKAAAAEREAKTLAAARAEAAANARAQAEAEYADRIRAKVRGNTVLPPRIQGNPEAEFAVVQLPDGTVLSVRLVKSSGQQLLDDAIERAIMKSSPLPLPSRPDLFRRDLRLKYRPYDGDIK